MNQGNTDINNTIWVVVYVMSGIPVSAEAFRDLETAWEREEALRKEMNPDNDEVGVFEINLAEVS